MLCGHSNSPPAGKRECRKTLPISEAFKGRPRPRRRCVCSCYAFVPNDHRNIARRAAGHPDAGFGLTYGQGKHAVPECDANSKGPLSLRSVSSRSEITRLCNSGRGGMSRSRLAEALISRMFRDPVDDRRRRRGKRLYTPPPRRRLADEPDDIVGGDGGGRSALELRHQLPACETCLSAPSGRGVLLARERKNKEAIRRVRSGIRKLV